MSRRLSTRTYLTLDTITGCSIMQLPPSDHVVWKIVRQMVVCGFLAFMLKYNYTNGWDVKDLGTLAITLMGLGGFDAVKQAVAPKADA